MALNKQNHNQMRPISRLLLLFVVLFVVPLHSWAQDCAPGLSTYQFITDQYRAKFSQRGSIWQDPYQIPVIVSEEDPVSSLFNGGIWLGGYDSFGDLRLAGSAFGSYNGNPDFYPGPLDATGESTALNCSNYDRFWPISQADIEAFQADFGNNGQLSTSHPNIIRWPAPGNEFFNSIFGFPAPTEALAPFVDRNGDGLYQPNQGEYPRIKGDQAVWWVFNDAGGPHEDSGGLPVHAEVQVMAYSFDTNETYLKNTSFYEITIKNKGQIEIDSFFTSLFINFDIGCFTDDYVGYLPEERLAFAYNDDIQDGTFGCTCNSGVPTYCESIPIIGLKYLGGFKNIPGQALEVSSFVPFNNAGVEPFPLPETTDPNTAAHFFNYMNGLWRDGSPITLGGSGFESSDTTTKFPFPDSPFDQLGWSMCQEDLPAGDRRFVLNIGPTRFLPGDVIRLNFAIVWVPDIWHPCPDITPLIAAGIAAETQFAQLPTSTTTPAYDLGLKSYPNPMKEWCRLELIDSSSSISTFQLYSSKGALVQQQNNVQSNRLDLYRNNLPAGIYYFLMESDSGERWSGKLILQ